MTDTPAFAVVGRPNKGKSSVVSTLAHDDSVLIAAEAGTTTGCRSYPMRIDGELIYTLIDTPGFQRARRAWAWLQERETTAAEHRLAVEQFVAVHSNTGAFPDECTLLAPLLDGAAILYVVDGSLPYGPEYEAEMEILRWTGQPSMALINCIGTADYIEPWTAALRQYFQVVRVFDAVAAPFATRLELLRAFGQLEQRWTTQLERAIEDLEAARSDKHRRAARAIAATLADMLSDSTRKHLTARDDPQHHHETLERDLMGRLRTREQRGRAAVESVYDHHVIDRSEADVELLDHDLFSTDDWYFWGLNRKQLVTAGLTGGAVVGGAIDVSVGGASLLLGSAIGAAVGGVSAVFGGSQLTKVRVLTLPLGGIVLHCGPVQHENFPYVVLGRALHHQATVAGRAHADRSTLDLSPAEPERAVGRLDATVRRSFQALFRSLRGGAASHEVASELSALIEPILIAR